MVGWFRGLFHPSKNTGRGRQVVRCHSDSFAGRLPGGGKEDRRFTYLYDAVTGDWYSCHQFDAPRNADGTVMWPPSPYGDTRRAIK